MEFFIEYGLFLAKTLTLIIGFLVLLGGFVNTATKLKKAEQKGHIEIEKLNDYYKNIQEVVFSVIKSPDEYKALKKEEKKKDKEKKKRQKQLASDGASSEDKSSRDKKFFVFSFCGDIKASEVAGLEKIISAILGVAEEGDEAILCLESSGGMVHSYGLAASQLARFKNKKIPLTVCVDKVAASGGYMMACIGDRILAAPFAMLGSIGVLAQIPNFHKLLKKHDIEYEQITAGEYKRTLTLFGENTDKGREKFSEEIEDTHVLFKDFVHEYRPDLNIDEVATGEVWFGTRALDKGLVDKLITSEEYLLNAIESGDVFKISYVEKRTFQERLGLGARSASEAVIDTFLRRDRESQLTR